jgi:hypothetical protein
VERYKKKFACVGGDGMNPLLTVVGACEWWWNIFKLSRPGHDRGDLGGTLIYLSKRTRSSFMSTLFNKKLEKNTKRTRDV